MIAVLFFILKAYLVLLAAACVFNVVGFAVIGTQRLLRLDPHDNKWASFTVALVITGGFLYLVGHLISGFLTPVSGH